MAPQAPSKESLHSNKGFDIEVSDEVKAMRKGVDVDHPLFNGPVEAEDDECLAVSTNIPYWVSGETPREVECAVQTVNCWPVVEEIDYELPEMVFVERGHDIDVHGKYPLFDIEPIELYYL
jgi:hypothetical protein